MVEANRRVRTQYMSFLNRAAKRNLIVDLTFERFYYLRNGRCHYCGVEPELIALFCKGLGIKTPYITIDRKDNKLGYSNSNCVTCCFVCNRIKSNFFSEEDMMQIGSRFVKPKLEAIRGGVWEDYVDTVRSSP